MKQNIKKYLVAFSAIPALLSGSNALADIQQLDDVIITFSLCVGNDCVNGENFGFDTVRIKENNVRIHFDDTSNSASFPQNDWRLIANDSTNGGLNYFAIEDATAGRIPFRVEAGAPANTLYVESDGDVGIKTAAPVVDLHIVEGNTPTVRLEQDGSDGFTAQTFDIAANETNFFIRDVTNGSRLFFRAEPGAPENSIYIDSNGDIGLGTSSPGARLHVTPAATGAEVIVGSSTTSGGRELQMQFSGQAGSYGEMQYAEDAVNLWSHGVASNNDFFYIYNYPNNRYDLSISPTDGYLGIGGERFPSAPIEHSNGASLSTAGIWTNASSRELKHNITEISSQEALNTLKELQPVTFNYNLEPGDQVAGFIAEDVPDIVATPDRKGLSSMDIVAVLTKVVQEQQASIERLEKKLEEQQTVIK